MKRIGRFSIVGIGVNASLYLLFLALVWTGLPAVAVSAFCYVLGVGMSYVLNRRWSFESRADHRQDLPRFLTAYGSGLVVAITSISLLVGPFGPALAQLVTIAAAAATTFGMLHVLRFGAER